MKQSSFIINIGSISFNTRKGGGAAVVRELINFLEREKYNYCNFEISDSKTNPKNNYYYSSTKSNILVKNFYLFVSLINKLTKIKQDKIYVITHNIPVIIFCMPVLLLNRRITHIHYFHGPAFLEAKAENKNFFYVLLIKAFELIFYFFVNKIVFLSKNFQSLFNQKYYKKKNTIIVPYSINKKNINFQSRSIKKRSNVKKMLTVRRLQKRMGIDILIKSCIGLNKNKYHLDIVGTGPEYKNLEFLIKKNNLESNINLCGRLSDEDLNYKITNCDFTIMPTRSLEGFGISIIDSLTVGVPVIAFDVGGMKEILHNLDSNLIIENVCEISLQSKLKQILMNEILLPNSKACKSYVLNNYTNNFKILINWMFTF